MERQSQFFSHVPLGTSVVSFTSVTADDIVSAISRLPDKSSSADLLLLSVMKLVADEIAPFLTELFNHFHVYWSLPIHIQRSLYHAGN